MGEAKRKATRGATGASPCGTCTMCCTLSHIVALDKPMYRPCRHLVGGDGRAGGCGVFGGPERPEACSAYECAYHTAHRTAHPDRRRIPHPLDAGAYFHKDPIENAIVVFVDPDRPLLWKSSAIVPILRNALAGGLALVIFDRGRRMTVRASGHLDEILQRDYVAFADAQGIPREIASYEAERRPQPSAVSSGSAIP
ncbi:hypothetical protein [Salinarimonas ramus]|uniref:YkgJ family cysteine cluster protein n=1 Tax=Salinarimonas ramus TaxID=690164 RepID=A0A917QAE6_9HYPH|nr:hypothetical protein [Salinarimonas ramus]GGK38694.1 hypothetical protein GCM10011322_27180 [Salinarimonas ramus]